MFVFWAVVGVLTAVAAGLILFRAAGAAAQAEAADPAPGLYRRQLSEIDELAERGLMGEAERKAAHAEAARRLLAAADAPQQAWNADPRARRAVLLAVAAAPALALGLYLSLGSPGFGDQPFAARLEKWRGSDLSTLTAPEIAAVLRQATAERPREAEGFRLLGLAEGASQNPVAAVRALRRAAELAPQRPDIWQMLGEAEVFEAQGKVDADAQAAFSRLLALDPKSPTARYFLASAKADAGRTDEAAADLRALLADLPPEEPERRAAVEAELAKLAGKPVPATRDPQQLAMIQGMVASLASKLEANPDDPEGWVRLVRAYAVLGDTAKRDAAYANARARYAGRGRVVQQLDEAARAEPMP
ncbi:MAG: c-type cytochrome biogenesis protein CcmI [Phenylobacterium sp. RIFCSPHIGHO2_01_FULL_69_31]|uniref:c-type cytochrome biogenesis protein CcmI n=1 Tax=Phenylobacterium sp. RIFCSPHIGHO2_01_FULL_69_31 TaxID=1801944 RepID=UPI0008C4A533|nr:c-type cytochrome biogenesis protein CcmI [Phenylobacterium sp. RIFCSPHIGHO2_01_FULL_69_31]OHB27658.1 MAG: c-type cytochrome biogenesis protein CcmI [Phenylobacterium sp. RIFCSPHIGHO2_01_FULL_69_31]